MSLRILTTAALLLLLLAATRLSITPVSPTQSFAVKSRPRPAPAVMATKTATRLTTPDAFYQTLIDTHLFRPLGWQPPVRQPQYELIGTQIAADATLSKAIILDIRANTLYTLSLGDKIGEAVMSEISKKRVQLNENGNGVCCR